jgi:hypothetical protein
MKDSTVWTVTEREEIARTDPGMVAGVKVTPVPWHGRTITGYGGKLPTGYMIRYGTRWHRVYMWQYGNSGVPYIVRGGIDLVLDSDTQFRLEGMGR